jgi:hypothetical protein
VEAEPHDGFKQANMSLASVMRYSNAGYDSDYSRVNKAMNREENLA